MALIKHLCDALSRPTQYSVQSAILLSELSLASPHYMVYALATELNKRRPQILLCGGIGLANSLFCALRGAFDARNNFNLIKPEDAPYCTTVLTVHQVFLAIDYSILDYCIIPVQQTGECQCAGYFLGTSTLASARLLFITLPLGSPASAP